jgi:hypothetical protein
MLTPRITTLAIRRLSPAVSLRLHFIDCALAHYGTLNRVLLMDYFGISQPQASIDIAAYKELAPDNMVYDSSTKRYRRTEAFKRLWP